MKSNEKILYNNGKNDTQKNTHTRMHENCVKVADAKSCYKSTGLRFKKITKRKILHNLNFFGYTCLCTCLKKKEKKSFKNFQKFDYHLIPI